MQDGAGTAMEMQAHALNLFILMLIVYYLLLQTAGSRFYRAKATQAESAISIGKGQKNLFNLMN